MTKTKARMIFYEYNPAADIVRCPNGRAKMRKPLDLYAKAAVNLYGIIRREEFVKIFNAQNEEQTTADEVYKILLPNVLKYGSYGFYKDYIVHYVVLSNFDWVPHLEKTQADKPRFIPPKEQFLKYEWEGYDEFDHWWDVQQYTFSTLGYSKEIANGFFKIKICMINTFDLKEAASILQKHNMVFRDMEQTQKFLDLLTLASNNTRRWENSGHTPNEMIKFRSARQPEEPVFKKHIKVSPNQRCPCGSGKKYKNCCALIELGGAAQISHNECRLFYETWYKLLNFINQKYSIISAAIKPVYPAFYDESQLFKIREKLWTNPKLIGEFIGSTDSLSDEEIRFLQLWEERHIKGRFLLVKYEPEYAVLMLYDKDIPPRLYAVKGMTTSIAEAMHRELPVMLETVLLPFGDKIIYDSYMTSHPISFGDGIQEILRDEFAKAKDEYGIITKL